VTEIYFKFKKSEHGPPQGWIALRGHFYDPDDNNPFLTADCVTASGLEAEAARLKEKIDRAVAEGKRRLSK
jgi:hypothetical protein